MNDRQAILSTGNEFWYTPSKYVEAAREVMGAIDLDPASDETGQRTVKADRYLTKDAFRYKWVGRVFLNPPYGIDNRYKVGDVRRSVACQWTHYLIGQFKAGDVTQAILLVNATPGNKWFSPLWDWPICLTDHRICFLDAQGVPQRQPTHSNAFVYFGERKRKFVEVFRRFGPVVAPLKFGRDLTEI